MGTKAFKNQATKSQKFMIVDAQQRIHVVNDDFIVITDRITNVPLFVCHKSQVVSYGHEFINNTEFYFIKYKPFNI